jgi:hypothetical protein
MGFKERKEGSTSFLKKRSKKLLVVLAAAFPDRAAKAERLWFFYSKKNRLLGHYETEWQLVADLTALVEALGYPRSDIMVEHCPTRGDY